MRRRLFTALSVLSLVACVATAGLWVRSYFVHDAFDWGTSRGRAGLFSAGGRLGVGHVVVPPSALVGILRGLNYRRQSPATELHPSWSSATGLQATYISQLGFTASDLRVPYWMLLVPVSTPALMWAYRRSRQPPPGYCATCGYNLTANTSGVCPECGKPTIRTGKARADARAAGIAEAAVKTPGPTSQGS